MIAVDLHGLLVACSVLVCRMCASFGSQNHAALVNFSTFLLKEVIKYEFQYSHIINYLSGFFSLVLTLTLSLSLSLSHTLSLNLTLFIMVVLLVVVVVFWGMFLVIWCFAFTCKNKRRRVASFFLHSFFFRWHAFLFPFSKYNNKLHIANNEWRSKWKMPFLMMFTLVYSHWSHF